MAGNCTISMVNGEPGHRVTLNARGEQRVRSGHPWIYRADVVEVDASGGDIVRVLGPRRRTIGYALFSDRSQIPIRMLTHDEHPPDEALIRTRLERAIRFRDSLGLSATAYRVVHGEADLLPSLVVDRYGDFLVVQTLSQAMDRLLPSVTRVLVELLAPAGILARNDPKVRALEGLDQKVEVLHGTIPESVLVHEGGIEYDVDLRRGQKTGLFLDQRENREAAARYARGRLLDCFSYQGGFALTLARHCAEVEAVDISSESVARIVENARAQRRVARAGTNRQCVRRAAAARQGGREIRHHRARPAGVREEQSVHSERHRRLQGDQSACDAAPRGGWVSGDLQLLVQRR